MAHKHSILTKRSNAAKLLNFWVLIGLMFVFIAAGCGAAFLAFVVPALAVKFAAVATQLLCFALAGWALITAEQYV